MEVDSKLVDELKQLDRASVEFAKKCAEVAQELNAGQTTIVQLLDELGPLLVDVAPSKRELGTWILTRVIETLPVDHFDAKQLEYVCLFYADRLKDNNQMIPAVLAGVLALTKFEHFPGEAGRQILTALFQNVACQQQHERDRRNIYQILDRLLQKCAPEITAMGLGYVYGIISTVDGERSPNNLLLLFNWFPKFCKKVNLGHLLEEAFEMFACYFPVDFKAPSQDPNPNEITRDELADALAACLTAIPAFGAFCLPLVLEKLDSSLNVAKLDALKLLEIGCATFDTSAYVESSTEIWSSLQKQLFNAPNDEIESACLAALTATIKKISTDPNHTTIKDIADTFKGNLFPDAKLFEPSAKFLVAVAKASREASKTIGEEIVPILANAFKITTNARHKGAVLALLTEIFYYNRRLCVDSTGYDDTDGVPILCLKAAGDDHETLRRVGFSCLARICEFLTSELRFSLYGYILKLVLQPQTKQFKVCLTQLAVFYPTEVECRVLELVEVSIHDELESYLDCLCSIVSVAHFTKAVVGTVLSYIRNDQQMGQVALRSLTNLLSTNFNIVQPVLGSKNNIVALAEWCMAQDEGTCSDDVAFVLNVLMGSLGVEQQQEVVDTLFEKITDFSRKDRIYLSYGILCRVKRDVAFDYKILSDLTNVIEGQNDGGGVLQNVGLQLLANLINKCGNESVLSSYLEQIHAFVVVPWVTKALIMRNHVSADVWTDKMIAMLDSNINFAVGFRIVMDDTIDALSPKSNCIRTLLYQQKFFNAVANKLCDAFCKGRESYLVAFGYLLENAPLHAVLLQLNRIFKLLIVCLDECTQSDILIIVLKAIQQFLVGQEVCVEDHFSEFLGRFLNLSTFDKSMRVRILALQCLQDCITSLPVYKLLPYKTDVITVVGKVLDDKKRIVRKEAVETRLAWFLLDAPM